MSTGPDLLYHLADASSTTITVVVSQKESGQTTSTECQLGNFGTLHSNLMKRMPECLG